MAMVDDVVLLSGTTPEKATIYLQLAKDIILNTMYPYGYDDTEVTDVPAKYSSIKLQIAVFLANKEGAEGETTHNEAGINRTYESAGVPSSYLEQIVPAVKVL